MKAPPTEVSIALTESEMLEKLAGLRPFERRAPQAMPPATSQSIVVFVGPVNGKYRVYGPCKIVYQGLDAGTDLLIHSIPITAAPGPDQTHTKQANHFMSDTLEELCKTVPALKPVVEAAQKLAEQVKTNPMAIGTLLSTAAALTAVAAAFQPLEPPATDDTSTQESP